MKITPNLVNNNIVLAALDSREYLQSLVEIMKPLLNKSICYVSLNKPYTMISNNLKQNGIDPSKMFFIDGVSKSTVPGLNPPPNCEFISSPNALTELGIAIGRRLKSSNNDLLLFDSLSTLLIYEKENTVIEFAHSIVNVINASGKKALFTCLQSDISKQFTNYLYMFFDQVVGGT